MAHIECIKVCVGPGARYPLHMEVTQAPGGQASVWLAELVLRVWGTE